MPASPRTLLCIDEAAERLNVGPRYIRRLIAERRIEFVKLGKHIRIPEAAIDAFISAGTVPAAR
jgi:excisionase family DNA binding protein